MPRTARRVRLVCHVLDADRRRHRTGRIVPRPALPPAFIVTGGPQ
tara:strand:+ start:872 stop:1006 length:135 start_codon:yes stop_codon:yes gene_type:complete